jgi:hypothetical protein
MTKTAALSGHPLFAGLAVLIGCGWRISLGTASARSQSYIDRQPAAAAAFSRDGTLAAFSRSGTLTAIDLPGWTSRWNAAARGGSIAALAFSHDGSRLAAAIGNYDSRGQPLDH